MRLTLVALTLVIVAFLPTLAAKPDVDDASRVTPTQPLSVGLFVPQTGRVALTVDVEQGAYDELALDVDEVCHGGSGVGSAIDQPPASGLPQVLGVSEDLTVDCGVLQAGWYVVTVSIGVGAARVYVNAFGGSIH